MNTIDALKKRNSTRAYTNQTVDREIIEKILDAANKTPSWANTQPWEVFVASGETLERLRQQFVDNFRKEVPPKIDIPFPAKWPEAHSERTAKMAAAHTKLHGIEREDKDARRKMSERNMNFFGAPVVIYLCMDKTLSSYSMFDVGAFSQSIMLAAQNLGLNTIPAAMFVLYADIVREELKIPDNQSIILGIALGYGDKESLANKHITTRRPLEEFVKFSD